MIFLMAGMPIIRSIDTGLGIHQLAGHKSALRGDFWFPNPWKYRIFSTWLVEESYQLYTATVDKIIPIDGLIKFVNVNSPDRFSIVSDLRRFSHDGFEISFPDYFIRNDTTGRPDWEIIKEFHRYFLVFALLRFALNFAILALAYRYYKIYISNRWMAFLAVVFLDNGMNNAFRDTAFGFDTYIDLLLFIIAILIIVKAYSPFWLVPVMVIGILNRETCLMIPVLFAVVNFVRDGYSIKRRNFLFSALLTAIGFTGFVGLRWYFGYEPYMLPSGWFRVVENFTNYSIISSQFAIMLVLPFLSMLFLRSADITLRTIWITIVPIWFMIHYYSFAVLEARYFLVPFSLAIIPIAMYGIEKSYLNGQRPGIV